jgi:Tfp pilus assembly protein PilO
MNKLSKEKRSQLILVALATAAALAVVFMGLIRPQRDFLARLAASQRAATQKLADVNKTIKDAGAIQSKLIGLSDNLSQAEQDTASGDLLAWTYDTLRRFKLPYKVNIPQIGQPESSSVDLLPNFPYKQCTVSVSGTAYYHDLGNFIANFENTFPHVRLVNLSLEPVSNAAADTGANEKLSFKMEIVALIRPNPSPTP